MPSKKNIIIETPSKNLVKISFELLNESSKKSEKNSSNNHQLNTIKDMLEINTSILRNENIWLEERNKALEREMVFKDEKILSLEKEIFYLKEKISISERNFICNKIESRIFCNKENKLNGYIQYSF